MTQALTEKPKLGRPLKFKTREELEMRVTAFFIACKENGDIPTPLGLAIALDIDRRNLLEYSKKDAFRPILKRAKAFCIHSVEQRMIKGTTNPPAAMFWLTNNTDDWINQRYENRSVHHSGTVNVNLIPHGGNPNSKRLKEGKD